MAAHVEAQTSSELGLCSSNAKREEAKELRACQSSNLRNLGWMVIKRRACEGQQSPKGIWIKELYVPMGGGLLESRVLALKNKSGGQRIKVEAP